VARAGSELQSIEDPDLPTLAVADGFDAAVAVLGTS
jgi:hypothetical protein